MNKKLLIMLNQRAKAHQTEAEMADTPEEAARWWARAHEDSDIIREILMMMKAEAAEAKTRE